MLNRVANSFTLTALRTRLPLNVGNHRQFHASSSLLKLSDDNYNSANIVGNRQFHSSSSHTSDGVVNGGSIDDGDFSFTKKKSGSSSNFGDRHPAFGRERGERNGGDRRQSFDRGGDRGGGIDRSSSSSRPSFDRGSERGGGGRGDDRSNNHFRGGGGGEGESRRSSYGRGGSDGESERRSSGTFDRRSGRPQHQHQQNRSPSQNASFDRRGSKNRETGPEFEETDPNKINLRELESQGWIHLYGISPVINALSAQRRNLTPSLANVDNRPDKTIPGARLFLQERDNTSIHRTTRTLAKQSSASQVTKLATSLNIPITYLDKGTLNSLTNSRPHGGIVLRCGELELNDTPFNDIFASPESPDSPKLWLALDEVVDPQNLGAILRSAYFLSGNPTSTLRNTRINVLVTGKNSAPLSPTVSAASAGALELCYIKSTTNLPKTLLHAKSQGWRILGAAASVPLNAIDEGTGERVVCSDLYEVDVSVPTILVMGSEGGGLRTLVKRSCNGFVKVSGGAEEEGEGGDEDDVEDSEDEEGDHDDDSVRYAEEHEQQRGESGGVGVDSLNVSVTAGILLNHFISRRNV